MGERNQQRSEDSGAADDLFDPMMAEFGDEEFEELEISVRSESTQSLAEKRRRAEQRLETLRLREELGDFDFDFGDDF